MSRSAAILGCVIALTTGNQTASALDTTRCLNNQIVDNRGHVVRDANGNPVPCGRQEPTASEQGLFDRDTPLYLGAGALMVGGGISAAVATSSAGKGGGLGGGSSQQSQLIYLLLLNNSSHPASP